MRDVKDIGEAARQLEAVLTRQLLREAAPAKGPYADMFVDALADAVANAGGLGLAPLLEGGGGAAAHARASLPAGAPTDLRAANAAGARAMPHPHAALDALGLERGGVAGLVAGGRVSSGYGPRVDPINGAHRFHGAVDVAAPIGAPIEAGAAGRVVFAGEKGGLGLVVEIEHAPGVRSRYAHASSIDVKVGDAVARGDTIARVGQTGRATGPHTHIELWVDGRRVDPRALQDLPSRN